MSTPSVVLTGYPPPCPDLAWGVGTLLGGTLPGYPPSWPGWGGTYLGTSLLHPDLAGGSTWVPPWAGYPPSWPGRGGTQSGYPQQGTPRPDLAGYPPKLDLAGYLPPRCLPHGILGNVAKHYGIWVPPPQCLAHDILGNVAKHYGIWVPPPPVDRQIDGWKDRRVSKHYLPVVLRTRAVIIASNLFSVSRNQCQTQRNHRNGSFI